MAKQKYQKSLPGLDLGDADSPPPTPPEHAESPVTSDQAAGHDSLQGKAVYVIDAHSLIHQVFHAGRNQQSPGEPIGAVFGFVRDLLAILEQKRPDYLVCAFDLSGKTFRHAMFEATRPTGRRCTKICGRKLPRFAGCWG